MLHSALFIARTDLGFMLRQRETLLWVFVMPGLFFYFIGTVTGGISGPSSQRPDPLAVHAPQNGGPIVDALLARLEEQNYSIERPESRADFERYARRLTIPQPDASRSVTEAVVAGQQVTVTLDRRGDSLVSDFDRFRVSRAVYSVLADLAVIESEGRAVTAEAFDELSRRPRALGLTVRSGGRRPEPPSGFAQAVPGTMVMFTMLVLLTSGAILLVVEREHGLLRRLASTPISRGAIVLGKWAARMALGLVQIGFAVTIGTVLFRVDWGESVPMVAAVLVAWAAFTASFAILLANLARTQAQMAGAGVLTTMVLAALGGCWWPIEVVPEWMQSLATLLPTGWTMDALHRLVSFGDPASAAIPHIAALGVSALGAGWAGARLFRYE